MTDQTARQATPAAREFVVGLSHYLLNDGKAAFSSNFTRYMLGKMLTR